MAALDNKPDNHHATLFIASLGLPMDATVLASPPCIHVSHRHEVDLVSRRSERLAAKSKARPAKLEAQATGVLLKNLGVATMRYNQSH